MDPQRCLVSHLLPIDDASLSPCLLLPSTALHLPPHAKAGNVRPGLLYKVTF